MYILIILLVVIFIIYQYLLYVNMDKLYVLVYSMDPKELQQSKKLIQEQYKKYNIEYRVFENEREFNNGYSDLIILKKKCIKCKFIPLGDVKFLVSMLPLDYFDLSKISE